MDTHPYTIKACCTVLTNKSPITQSCINTEYKTLLQKPRNLTAERTEIYYLSSEQSGLGCFVPKVPLQITEMTQLQRTKIKNNLCNQRKRTCLNNIRHTIFDTHSSVTKKFNMQSQFYIYYGCYTQYPKECVF